MESSHAILRDQNGKRPDVESSPAGSVILMLLRENFAGIATGVYGKAPIFGHFLHASLYPPVSTGKAVGLSRETELSCSALES
jgi:hypothetical protein